ncbi:MAG: hypothetical protein JSS60_00740 [Verrucomicrobia bacterium]|nr:hypothetical protein [Verrucomicrobiota bacterium]
MKKALVFIGALAPFALHSLEFDMQFENEQVRVSKIVMAAKEEVGLHRDELPRVVIGLKGGTVRRMEQDGSTRDVHFPTGSAVFLEADPEGEMHRGVNVSDTELEVMIIELKGKAS